MNADFAERLALEALGHVAEDVVNLERFLTASGLSPAALRAHLADLALLGGILDFILDDDGLLKQFCEASGHPPEQVIRARAALPGGIGDWA